MKKFLATKFLSNKNKTVVPTEVNQSVKQIQTEVETLSKEIQELEKEIRIDEKIYEKLEIQLNEEIAKNDAIDKEIKDIGTQIKILTENIESQEKEIESAEQTERELQQIIETMEKDFEIQYEEKEKEIKHLPEIKDHFEKQFEVKQKAYQSLNQTFSESFDSDSDFDRIELKKNELKTLQTKVESFEKKIQEIKDKKNKLSNISPEMIEWFSDPIRVIVEIAKIKVESNRLEKIISNEIIRRKNLKSNNIETKSQENNELNPVLNESTDNKSDNKSEYSVDQFVVTNIYENEDKTTVSGNEAIDFNMFGTETTPTSPTNQSPFNLFGNQSPPEDQNNELGFGLPALFGEDSESGTSSPNIFQDSFNFFK